MSQARLLVEIQAYFSSAGGPLFPKIDPVPCHMLSVSPLILQTKDLAFYGMGYLGGELCTELVAFVDVCFAVL